MNTVRYFTLLFLGITSIIQAQLPPQSQDSVGIVALKEIQLIGIRANENTPVTFSNVTKEEIESRNLGQDIPILLNYLPGVVTTSDAGAGIGYTGIRVRGSDATRVNITINGIPYNDAESQGTFWVNLPDFASSVSQFQLQRGVGTSTNGAAAFGASLNLETEAPSSETQILLSSSMGSFATLKNTIQFNSGLLQDRFQFSGRWSSVQSKGYIDRARSDLKGYFFQGKYQQNKTALKALFFGGHEITYQSWYGIDAATLAVDRTHNPAGEMYDTAGNRMGYYDNQVDDYTQQHYQFHWNQNLNSNWDLSMGFNYTNGQGFYEEYNDLWATNNLTFGSETQYDYLKLVPYPLGEQVLQETENITQKWLDNEYYVATIGLQYQTPNTTVNLGGLLSHYDGNHFGQIVWGQFLGTAQPNQRFYENQGVKNEESLFVKVFQSIGQHLTGFVDVQVRGIHYSVSGEVAGPSSIYVQDDFFFLNPKAGITFAPSASSKVYFSFAKAQREPNRTDYENGTPKPEKLNDFELGWRIKKNKFQGQANVYWMEYQDQLVLTGALDAVGSPIRQNVGKSRRVGLELEGKLQLGNHWMWQPNIALSRNQNLDFYFKRNGILTALGNTILAFSPSVIAGNAVVFSPTTPFQIALLSKYVGEQYMGNIDAISSKLKAYFTSDLNIVYRWFPKKGIRTVQGSLLVNNIFNHLYESNGYFYTYDDDWSTPGQITTIEGAGYYPQAGTHILAGIQIEL